LQLVQETAGKREKAVFKWKLLLLDTLYAMSAFFAPDHIKVFIFIKFLIPPRKCWKALKTILADRQNSVLSMSFIPYPNKISDQSCILSWWKSLKSPMQYLKYRV
jgi:hypothetical protein